MQFSTFVTSITQDEIAPRVIDTVLNSNVLSLRILGNPEKWNGETMKFPIKYQKNTQGGSYDGWDQWSTQQQNTRVSMSFNVKGEVQPVTLNGMQVAVNSTDAQVLSLVGTEMESCKQDMIDNIGTRFYGDGTGNSNKDFTGLAAAVDDGSVAASYGGLSRSTYTGLQSPVTTGVGNLTLSAMGSLFDEISVTGEDPTLIVTTNAVWSFYEQLLTPTVRASYQAEGYAMVGKNGGLNTKGGLGGQAGFVALNYRGVPVVKDNKCTSGYMYFLNENYIKFYALDRSDLEMRDDKGAIEGFYSDENTAIRSIYWRPFLKPVNQDAEIGAFIMNGELINKNPRKSGVLQGITGV